jgi:methylthioribose-1-phosphate isomerase
MERQDDGLAFMLKYENAAWYDGETVRILDRRVYPARVEYVTCRTYADVIAAIKAMVTQSGGPYIAAAMGMALAALEIEADHRGAAPSAAADFAARITRAAWEIAHARPTTAGKMAAITEACARVAIEAKAAGKAPDKAVFDHSLDVIGARYARAAAQARYLVDQFPDNGTVMTQCFAETIVGTMLRECRARGKVVKVICPETRPYFQGARLTASVVRDMDFDVTVITDNMPGYAMKAKHVDVFTSAADVICMDGHIVNKVGTFQIALAARYWGIPYFCTGSPNREHPTIDTDVLEAMGVRTAMAGVHGFYPAFDITPPKLCDGIVTDKGIYPPYDLARYYR